MSGKSVFHNLVHRKFFISSKDGGTNPLFQRSHTLALGGITKIPFVKVKQEFRIYDDLLVEKCN